MSGESTVGLHIPIEYTAKSDEYRGTRIARYLLGKELHFSILSQSVQVQEYSSDRWWRQRLTRERLNKGHKYLVLSPHLEVARRGITDLQYHVRQGSPPSLSNNALISSTVIHAALDRGA